MIRLNTTNKPATGSLAGSSTKPSGIIAALSFAGLLTLLVAVPIVLITVGGLPSIPEIIHAIMNPGKLLHALHASVPGIVVLRIFEVACWLGWLWFTGCVVTEILARITHRTAKQVPGSRTMQAFVACLIGLSMGILPLARHADTGRVIRLHALRPSEITCLFQDTGSRPEPVNAASNSDFAGSSGDLHSKPTDDKAGAHKNDQMEVPKKKYRESVKSSHTPDNANHAYNEATYDNDICNEDNQASNFAGNHYTDTSTRNLSIELTYDTMNNLPSEDIASITNKSPIHTYTVLPGDSLWSIAKKELGSGTRWREIASLNEGRLQPDGEIFGQSKWVLPGWELVIPASGDISGSQGMPTWLNGSHEASKRRTAPGKATLGRTTLDRTTSPSSPAPVVSAAPADTTPTEAAAPTRPPVAPAEPPVVPAEPPTSRPPIQPPGGIRDIGLSSIGATVLFSLDRRRRVQGRYRNTGFTVRLPAGELTDYERHLRISADADSMEWVRTAVRSIMSISLKEHGIQVAPHIIRLCADRVDVALDDSSATTLLPVMPSIFKEIAAQKRSGQDNTTSQDSDRTEDGVSIVWDGGEWQDSDRTEDASIAVSSYHIKPYHWWSLPRSEAVRARLINDPWYAQVRDLDEAFVTVGRDNEGIIMIDLGAIGSINLDTDQETSNCMLASLAIELATAPWTIYGNILTAGLPHLDGFNERIKEVESLPLAIPQFARIVSRRHRTEDSRESSGDDRNSVFGYSRHGARMGDLAYSNRGKTVVLVSSEQASKYRESCVALASLVGDGNDGLSAVIGDIVPNARSAVRWTSEKNDGELLIPGNHILLNDIASITSKDVDGITALLNTAQNLDGDRLPEQHFNPGHTGTNHQSDNTQTLPSGNNRIEICLLGEARVYGLQRPFTRSWALDLIAYLAIHSEGASSGQWATALWPDRLMAQSTLHSIASDARRALGLSPDGEEYLPKSHGRLALHPSVICDVHALSILSRSPNAADWRAGLELIRDKPLQGLKSYDWALMDGTLAYLESEVVDLALKYAEHCLDNGDGSGAAWAARKGLLVSQYDERLYRILMRSADIAGNPSGVDKAMRELIHLVAEDLEPYDSVHPDTIELYKSLARHKATAVMV